MVYLIALSQPRWKLTCVPCAEAGVNGTHSKYLTNTVQHLRGALAKEVDGIWSEILPLLVALEWDRAAAGLSKISLQSSIASVQAYMQVQHPVKS